MRNWLIRKLGGMTKHDHAKEISKLKDDCEKFFNDYCNLYGDNHSWRGVLNDAKISGTAVFVHKCQMLGDNCSVDSFVTAPWRDGAVVSSSYTGIIVNSGGHSHFEGNVVNNSGKYEVAK